MCALLYTKNIEFVGAFVIFVVYPPSTIFKTLCFGYNARYCTVRYYFISFSEWLNFFYNKYILVLRCSSNCWNLTCIEKCTFNVLFFKSSKVLVITNQNHKNMIYFVMHLQFLVVCIQDVYFGGNFFQNFPNEETKLMKSCI